MNGLLSASKHQKLKRIVSLIRHVTRVLVVRVPTCRTLPLTCMNVHHACFTMTTLMQQLPMRYLILV
jgi:hypothetical protein